MPRVKLVTKLGLVELARLTHEYLNKNFSLPPTRSTRWILRQIAPLRQYGRFDGVEVVTKIRQRRRKRWRPPVPVPLLDRLHRRRVKQVVKVFFAVFSVAPSGGCKVGARWQLDYPSFHAATTRSGYFNHRTVALGVQLRIHPHWHRRLGCICRKLGRFFLDITEQPPPGVARRKAKLWALEVLKSRGYTFRSVWVPLKDKEIRENALDQLDPWQTVGLLGLAPLPVVHKASCSGTAASATGG